MSAPTRRPSGGFVAKAWRFFVRLFYDFLDSLNLLADRFPGEDKLSQNEGRTIRKPARAGNARNLAGRCVALLGACVRQCFQLVGRIRNWAMYVLHGMLELLYVIGLSPVSDGIEAHRIWTPKRIVFVLPIIVFALAALALMVRVLTIDSRKLIPEYAVAAQGALDQKDHAAATVYLQRLVELGQKNAPAAYELALCADAQGEKERAEALMAAIAPANRNGHWPAHLWQAERLLKGPVVQSAELALAEAHLRRTLNQQPTNHAANRLLAMLLLNQGQLAASEAPLAKAADADPELLLMLSRLRANNRMDSAAIADARRAVDYLTAQLVADPDNITIHLQLAEAYWRAEQHAAAEKILSDVQNRPLTEPIRVALANLSVTWSISLDSQSTADAAQRRALLEQALRNDAWNLPAIQRLLSLEGQSGPDADWAATTLLRLNWAQAPASIHLASGSHHWARGQQGKAREHFEAAHRLDPHRIEIANNLAWALSQDSPKELDRALELVNSALKTTPIEPSLRTSILDTRGRILMMLQRWDEALKDLESVAAVRSGDEKLDLALARCYDNLGMPDLAEYRRRLAQSASQLENSGESSSP